jgi:hypothetical protein
MDKFLFASRVFVALASTVTASACGGRVEYDGRGADDASTGTGTSTSTSTGTSTGVSTATFTGTSTATATATVTSTTTLTGTPTATDTGTCGDLAFAEPECDECANAECCAEMATCSAGTNCDQVLQCILFTCVPEDPECIDTCKAVNRTGALGYDALFGCLEQACLLCFDEMQ